MTSAYHIGGFMNLNIQVPVRDPDPGNWDKCPPTPGSVGAVGRWKVGSGGSSSSYWSKNNLSHSPWYRSAVQDLRGHLGQPSNFTGGEPDTEIGCPGEHS